MPLCKIRVIVEKAWRASKQALIITEPGTPDGYRRIIKARTQLISLGASIHAPCPHNMRCPMDGNKTDWCHFSARVPRIGLHRLAKQATLPYEDEKYSYLIALKQPGHESVARIVKNPICRKGHVILDLCTTDGLQRETVSQKKKPSYKLARKSRWGDSWSTV